MKPGDLADTISMAVRNRGAVCEDLGRTSASQAYWRVWKETRSRGLADFAREAVLNQSDDEQVLLSSLLEASQKMP